jgi:hypothetical protein
MTMPMTMTRSQLVLYNHYDMEDEIINDDYERIRE